MDRYVVALEDVDATQVASVGGKAANLGELMRIDGVAVPPGFCVTIHAFRRAVAQAPPVASDLEALGRLDPRDREAIRTHSARARAVIEALPVPADVAAAIAEALSRLGGGTGYAVRSSATAEDLPGASFAGQQDSYLNVAPAEVLRHVVRCWASLFTERAVAYRLRTGIGTARMAVVVQRMVVPEASGVLFTADPVTGLRKMATVEAVFGLGEALVSGRAGADVFRVGDGEILSRSIAAKPQAAVPAPGGGTTTAEIDPERRDQPALPDADVLRLVELGRRIERHLGRPQDIEWCQTGGGFVIVQARPITTLFPVPETDDGATHVYISVGHQQMMTDAMKPLGISVWQLTAGRPMHEAGSRLFVDVTAELADPSARARLLGMAGKSDPLIGDALQTLVDRGDVVPPHDAASAPPPGAPAAPEPLETDAAIVTGLIARGQEAIGALERDIRGRTGEELFTFIEADFAEMRRTLFDPENFQAIMAGIEAVWWLNDTLEAWLGEKGAADTLIRAVPHNVTSEMGLALLDVADAVRPHPEVVAYLRHTEDGDFLTALDGLPGGREAREAIEAWLDRYGMRCVGEIDITRPRWRERPLTLVPVILANVDNFEPGAAARHRRQGRRQAEGKRQELLARLRGLPDGETKAAEAERMIDRARTFIGYREYPKYHIVSRYFLYKQALLAEAERLARDGIFGAAEDAFFLTFSELRDAVRTRRADLGLIARRKEAYQAHRWLTPPRVLTSDGEVVTGAYRRDDVPPGALVGLGVSAGTVEGRARVVLTMEQADVEPGDILVTTHTDPSWTPLFVTVAGLVTEVGGLMTHGAVVAREYGLPAVVGVEDATTLVPDGRRIRIDGAGGFVEILP